MILSQLKFPANIYANAIQLAYGSVEYTGYGVAVPACGAADGGGGEVAQTAVDIPAAQRHVARLLLERLPAAPARVLEVGCGLGTLARQMTACGHRVTAISDDPFEVQHLEGLPAHCVRLEDFTTAAERFDVIVLHNSAHYIPALKLLGKARDLLRPGGQLLMADIFIQNDEEPAAERLPVLKHFQQLAQRMGFQLQHQQQFDAQAGGCLGRLLLHLKDLQDELQGICRISQADFQQLLAALERSQEDLRSGRHIYALLDFTSPATVTEEYCDIDGFGVEEVAPLFERSFGVAFDPAIWNWKYGSGRGRSVCIRQGDQVVAHYGGAPRDILYFGAPHKAIQICDVMVEPQKRSFYSRQGLFFKSAATFLEQYVGNTAEHLLGIGFPNIKAMHVASRLGLYDKTDDFIEVLYPAPAQIPADDACGYILEPLRPRDAGQVNDLWTEMAGQYREAIIGVRDWAYLEYRYLQHPSERYRCYKLVDSDSGRLRAALIVRRHEDGWLLMDVLALQQDMPELVACMHGLLCALEGQPLPLRCWITRSQALHVRTDSSQLRDMQVEIPCNRWSKGPAGSLLSGAWWLTAGDMDFM